MLDAAALLEDRVPDIGAVLGFLLQQLFEMRVLDHEAAGQASCAYRYSPGSVRCRQMAPPQMMLIDAVGAIAILQLKRSITPWSAASGQGPRSLASIMRGFGSFRQRYA